MPIESSEVKVIEHRLHCHVCNTVMVHDGAMLASNPPQFKHVCPNCGETTTVWNAPYPRIEYVDKET